MLSITVVVLFREDASVAISQPLSFGDISNGLLSTICCSFKTVTSVLSRLSLAILIELVFVDHYNLETQSGLLA